MNVETKAGIFFLLALIILGVLTFQVEDLSNLWRETYPLKARVKHAAGLEVGDTVAVAGLAVGKVTDMRLSTEDDWVHIEMSIDRRFAINKGSTGVISWSGLLGGRYVDITRDTESVGYLTPGDELQMREAIRPDEIFGKLQTVVADLSGVISGEQFKGFGDLLPKLDRGLTSLNTMVPKIEEGFAGITRLVKDLREGKGTFTRLLQSDELYNKFNTVADDLKSASGEVSRVVKARSDDLDKIIADLRETSPQLKEAVASLRDLAEKGRKGEGPLMKLLTDKKMAEDLDKAVASLRRFAAQIDTGKGLLKRLVTDEALAKDLEETVANLKRVSESLAKGEGTAGRLMTDPKLYQELKDLVAEARDMLRDIKEQIPVGALGSAVGSVF